MLIVILSVIRIKYIVSTPEKSMLYYSTMSVPKNKQYLDPHKIVIIFCLSFFAGSRVQIMPGSPPLN